MPDGAVVQWEGLAWAYVQRGPGRYHAGEVPPIVRRRAAGSRVPRSPRVTRSWSPGQELLSEEFRARVTVGDESGE